MGTFVLLVTGFIQDTDLYILFQIVTNNYWHLQININLLQIYSNLISFLNNIVYYITVNLP